MFLQKDDSDHVEASMVLVGELLRAFVYMSI